MNVRTAHFAIVAAVFVMGIAASSCAQAPAEVSAMIGEDDDGEIPSAMYVDVAYLSSDLLRGREAGTRGEQLAAQYIASRFAELGLQPAGPDGAWYQPFEFRVSSNPNAAPDEGEQRTSRNVVGLLDNGADRTVVIGAHYDHLGFGGFGSRQPGDSLIHNGADDNASGVAAMLEIAGQLGDSEAKANNYAFVAFSGEELGLYGSKHFVQSPSLPGEINYMINLDMVGRLGDERRLAVNGTGTSPAWEDVLDVADANDLTISQHASGLGPSDHSSFYLEGIPVLHLFTGQHAEYHKPGDDSHLINYGGIVDIASFTVEMIEALDGKGRLEFTTTQDEERTRRAAFKVTLGIMPDYVSTSEGVRIDAVLDGRPAAKAGLKKGDVIIKLGDLDVPDINAYMEALTHFEPGDVTMILVRRDDDVVQSKVTF